MLGVERLQFLLEYYERRRGLIYNKNMKRLILVLLILGITAILYFMSFPLSIKNTTSHTVEFSPSACFACYGCYCEYTVDKNKTYELNEFYKAECIDYQGDVGKDRVNISLKGKEFDDFIKCVEQFDGIPSPSHTGN